jgi:ABC-type multidrug transport system ATPase subunit
LSLVEVRGLTVEADGVRLLGPASFSAGEGDIVLVTGPSGSGKTTLLRALTGSATKVFGLNVRGYVRVGGVHPSNTRELSRIAFYVPQEPWYALSTPYTLYEILLHTGLGVSEAEELLGRLGLRGKLLESTVWLSAGEAERLLYAEALASGRRVLLVDEVTSYLDPWGRRAVVRAAVEAASEGRLVVVVDHDVRLWRGIATKTLYVEGGSVSVYSDPAETPVYAELEGLQERLQSLRERLLGLGGGCSGGEAVVEVEKLWFRYPDSRSYTIRGVSFTVCRGEIMWVRGVSGRGKTTLLKLLAGIFRPSRGRIVRRARGQLVPENPLLYLSEPTPREELQGNEALAGMVGLGGRLDTPILKLSSGERRRLALASAYARSPSLLLVDEPTVGLDPWNAVRVVELLAELASRGAAVVVATHSAELGSVASRVVEV